MVQGIRKGRGTSGFSLEVFHSFILENEKGGNRGWEPWTKRGSLECVLARVG